MDRFDDLVVFVEVVDVGSLSLAGERLGMSPSAVSRRISQLEDRLGAQLLTRTTRRLSLTNVGASFCHRARAVLAALDEAERSVGEMGQEPRGLLRIASPALFGQLHLAPLLPPFLARYPKVQVEVCLLDRVAPAAEANFDALLRVGRLADSMMIARRLAPLRHAVLASPGYLERRGRPMALSDLARHECLAATRDGVRLDWEFAVGCITESVKVGGPLQADDPAVLKAAALAGCGLVRLPTYLVGPEVRDGRLVPVLDDFAVRDTSVHVTYPAARHLAPTVRAFVDHLVAEIGRPAFWAESGLLPPWEAGDA